MLATERDDSALLPGMFRLAISGPDEPQPVPLVVNGPFALIGRDESCFCRLNHPDVSRRHAYLQAIFGRIFCIDLGSRNGTHWGDTPLRSGWLDPGVPIRIGPYRIEVLDSIGLGKPSAPFPENFSPLDPYAGQLGKLPRVDLEILNGAVPSAEMTVSRLITLVGSSARCKLRLQHSSVARVDCGLLWLVDGLWVVDLSGRGHSRLRGKVLRCARLENDQNLRLGRFHLRVNYSSDVMQLNQSEEPASIPGQLEIQLAPADEPADPPRSARVEVANQGLVEDEHAAIQRERRKLMAERHAAHERERALDAREVKFAEAQARLASEWEHLHVDRAAYDALAADFARRQEDLAARLRRLAEDTESLGRQRIELANRNAELADFKQRLAYEWQRLMAERGMVLQAGPDGTYPVLDEPVADPGAQPDFAGTFPNDMEAATGDFADPSVVEPVACTPTEFDVLESVRHNKVFAANRAGMTLVVTPLGDASEFHYGDVHVESNKVRRLLEGGSFRDLVVDLGETEVYSQVTFNVVVALSRIISNRGGQAVLCRASEKTRGLLQSMRLLDVWPLYDSRDDALQAVDGPHQS
jgi:anti-anti-sigma regulatory factor